jgi:ribulose-5-phosphate 4-epimerase/fuculose-1-phosphate aldolase
MMETIAARKYAIIEKIMRLNEEELTELETSLIKFLDGPISIEQYNRELDEAEAEIDRGESYSQEEVEKMIKNDRG